MPKKTIKAGERLRSDMGKQGKNENKKSDMADEDLCVMTKMGTFTRNNILPKWKFLTERWEIFLENPKSFCQAVITFCDKEIGAR